jgi:hypothetical protein
MHPSLFLSLTQSIAIGERERGDGASEVLRKMVLLALRIGAGDLRSRMEHRMGSSTVWIAPESGGSRIEKLGVPQDIEFFFSFEISFCMIQ